MTARTTPDDILTDDRLAAMRSAVMAEVDTDVQARRRSRRRRTMGIAAAAAIAVVAVGGGVVVNQFQDTGSDKSFSVPGAGPQTAARGAAESAPVTGGAPLAAPAPQAAPTTGPMPPPTPTPITNNRHVVTTGTVTVTSTDPAAAAKDLAATAERLDGRVDERRETRGDQASATLRLRIPSERITELLDRAGSVGTVASVELEHEDVTDTAVDLDARIRATQVSVDRLSAVLARAETTDQVIAAESALTSRQQELESLQSRRASIADRVSLSTVTVTIEKPTVTVDRSGFAGGLQDGWDALLAAGRWLLVIAGAVLPWAALLALLYAAYRAVRAARRHS
ncbi:hypothetical protein AXK57_06350 [Tsukamurella pulmonis]|uniref:DUF4349 domain-containing protein n=2 Tax=Tsukamurella pulmonis TaxID=47312 RepID=UPI00079C406E|nr:DUF4349 domain-containing protein [Tsukamurella pulmonis]KXP10989.1 hypothetical protein AXK57_06350 [Tsukamurella pulmonis]